MRAREILRSTRRVLTVLADAGVPAPSVTVVDKVGDLLRRNKRFPRRWPNSANVYPIVSEDGQRVYATTIVFNGHGMIDLKLSHCTCEAGHAGTLCHHLLSALVNADHLGYRMETSS